MTGIDMVYLITSDIRSPLWIKNRKTLSEGNSAHKPEQRGSFRNLSN